MLTVSGLKRLHIAVSFDLQDGECVALQGPSGVGKTLLLRSIADLDPNEGAVKLDGTPREAVFAPAWRKQVTYLAAEPGWWSDIVQEHFTAWVMHYRWSCVLAFRATADLGRFRDFRRARDSDWGLCGG
ncbi:ABC-type iron transport system FetAB ATPase subunit [Bradyrhizobium centrosematis]|nr:ABC-type iron transport system FetAB ATPase subunit [Bradyrhizobium centrosematis]MCS3775756.1 ABC-type iron transport system FetAB ATPase subunit [Bradyrhizobium centrosematis]